MFNQKNIVIIGATSGIGLTLLQNLTALGANVYSYSRSENHVNQHVNHHVFDVTQSAINALNLPDVIDGFVYCPGTINLKPFNRITESDFLNEFNINALGAAKTIQYILPQLKNSSQASIVLFSTVAVKIGMPFHASIAMAKGAVEGLTKSLAAEFAPKVRVNCIAPSLTQTPLADKLINTPEKLEAGNKRHPLQRIGQSNDLAKLAQFLLSDESSWITGQILAADGGMSSVKTI